MPGIGIGTSPHFQQKKSLLSYWKTSNLVIEGHSFLPASKNLPRQIRDLLNVTSYYNAAVNASVVTDIEARAATVDSKLVTESGGIANILVLWIGTNDISLGGSAADVFAAVQSYVNDRVAAGWHLFVYTCTPSTGISQDTINSFNTLLKTLASSKVDVIDVDLATELSDSTDTDYFIDGLHPTIAGEYAASQLLYDVLVAKYSNALAENNISPEVELTLTSTGAGYSTLTITSNVDNYLVISDGGGNIDYNTILNLSVKSRFIAADTETVIYFENAAAVSNFKFQYANIKSIALVKGANGPTIGGNIAQFVNLEYFNDGAGSWSGSIAGLTSLTYIRCTGTNTLTGSVEALTSLTRLEVGGSNTISGSIAVLTLLEHLSVQGSNTLSGSFDALPITYINLGGSNTVSGDLSNISATLTYCYFYRGALTTYTGGATWPNIIVYIYNRTGYQLSKEEVAALVIDLDNSVAGPTSKLLYISGHESLADTSQGGAWGDFSGDATPSALAVAYKSLIITKSNTGLTDLGVTAPGVSGDGTGFPAGFGDWYRS